MFRTYIYCRYEQLRISRRMSFYTNSQQQFQGWNLQTFPRLLTPSCGASTVAGSIFKLCLLDTFIFKETEKRLLAVLLQKSSCETGVIPNQGLHV